MGEILSKCCNFSNALPPTQSLPQIQSTFPAPVFEKPPTPGKQVNQIKQKKPMRSDFEPIGKLGTGGFGTVYLVRRKGSDEKWALKEIKKSQLNNKTDRTITVDEILSEKDILMKTDNPFLVKLKSCFQDDTSLFFLMEVVEGGNMFNFLNESKKKYFSEEQTRFYSAEVVLALEHLHYTMKIIYRDLKPENILLGKDGHIKLSDFGLAKKAEFIQGDVKGTPDFIAPEVYARQEYTKMVDYWSLGCLIYEWLQGKPAFSDSQKEKRINKIKTGKFTFSPEISISNDAQDIITKLLQVKVSNRLGYNGIAEIKGHPFFSSTNWTAMAKKETTPPYQKIVLNYKPIKKFEDTIEQTGEKVDGFTYMPDSYQPK